MAKEEEKDEDKPGVLTRDTDSSGRANLIEAIEKIRGKKKGKPSSSYELVYDAPSSQLEPIYFWILDFIQGQLGIPIQKITDNFTTAPGSGHFAEMGARSTRMQEEGMKFLGMINQVVKTILNLVYDLKEFEIRLQHYKDADSSDKNKSTAGGLALKQIWLDNVDMKKGNTSIKAMTFSQAPFATLIDAFMIIKDETLKRPDGGELDLNDRVKRILRQRILEFNQWKKYSKKELQKRYEIERSYLRTEVESMKLYTSWARPYLKAAEQLRQKGFETNPALVNAFNTTMFELVLFGKKKIDLKESIMAEDLPKGFKNYKMKRDYFSCYVVSFVFRGLPQKVTQQHYGFGGMVDMNFDCYALNNDELKLIEKELEKKDIEDGLMFVQKATDESLEQLKEDIDHFLNKEKEDEDKKEEKDKEDTNPFSALFSLFKPKKKEKKKAKEINLKNLKKDNFIEARVRELAEKKAKSSLYKIYDIYKKGHGMASSFSDFDY